LKEKEQRKKYNFMSQDISPLLKIHQWLKQMGAYFNVGDLTNQGCGNQSIQISSIFGLFSSIFCKNSEDKSAKIVPLPVETPTCSNQVTHFHRDGFFKATPNPPFFMAPKKTEMKVKKKKCHRQKITKQ